jgi:hypothetical protein
MLQAGQIDLHTVKKVSDFPVPNGDVTNVFLQCGTLNQLCQVLWPAGRAVGHPIVQYVQLYTQWKLSEKRTCG